MYFRGDNGHYAVNTSPEGVYASEFTYTNTWISVSGETYVYGNIMSLLDSRNYKGLTTLTENNTFVRLFSNNPSLLSHPFRMLELPATTLTENCYASLFSNTGISKAPELPALNVPLNAYGRLFAECERLVHAPKLPATVLAETSYRAMFYMCSNLVDPPELPALQMANACYTSMFYGCTSLTSAPKLWLTAKSPCEVGGLSEDSAYSVHEEWQVRYTS